MPHANFMNSCKQSVWKFKGWMPVYNVTVGAFMCYSEGLHRTPVGLMFGLEFSETKSTNFLSISISSLLLLLVLIYSSDTPAGTCSYMGNGAVKRSGVKVGQRVYSSIKSYIIVLKLDSRRARGKGMTWATDCENQSTVQSDNTVHYMSV